MSKMLRSRQGFAVLALVWWFWIALAITFAEFGFMINSWR